MHKSAHSRNKDHSFYKIFSKNRKNLKKILFFNQQNVSALLSIVKKCQQNGDTGFPNVLNKTQNIYLKKYSQVKEKITNVSALKYALFWYQNYYLTCNIRI